MNEVFASTMSLRDSRDLLINSERILLIERIRETDTAEIYKILFDNGQEIQVDSDTGKMLCHALGQISRPQPFPPAVPGVDRRPVRPPRRRGER